jgi:hypothetical protein
MNKVNNRNNVKTYLDLKVLEHWVLFAVRTYGECCEEGVTFVGKGGVSRFSEVTVA